MFFSNSHEEYYLLDFVIGTKDAMTNKTMSHQGVCIPVGEKDIYI